MGKLTVNSPDDLIKQLERMGDLDRVMPKMLSAAMGPVAKAVRKNLRKHVQSGNLIDSVTEGTPKKNRSDVWVAKINFKGYDKDTKVPNPIKAIALEYGTSNQDASPFIRPAIIETEEQSVAAMQDIFEFEVGLKSL